MKRTARQTLANQTVEIFDRGTYIAPSGQLVDLTASIKTCLDSTRLLQPTDLKQLRNSVLAETSLGFNTKIEVVNETTLSGISRLLSEESSPVAALNFASARNPGGGFLNGSEAQEESLARSSGLYASQLKAWDFYAQHRASSSLLYSHAMILSPGCPIIRDDSGALLESPQVVGLMTCAAPNAGALAKNHPNELSSIPDVFRKRAEYVLAAAAAFGYTRLVLGAWGCGVFRNNPQLVAEVFAAHLFGLWAGRFKKVVFSVLDTSPEKKTFAAFETEFGR